MGGKKVGVVVVLAGCSQMDYALCPWTNSSSHSLLAPCGPYSASHGPLNRTNLTVSVEVSLIAVMARSKSRPATT